MRRVVADANIVMTALLKDAPPRHPMSAPLDLHTPEALGGEIHRNRTYLMGKSRATPAAFDLLISLLKAKIGPIPNEALAPSLNEALERLGVAHRLDAPYLAAAIAIDGTLRTHDNRLRQRGAIDAVGTRDVLSFVEESSPKGHSKARPR